jgi:hypothetical protein
MSLPGYCCALIASICIGCCGVGVAVGRGIAVSVGRIVAVGTGSGVSVGKTGGLVGFDTSAPLAPAQALAMIGIIHNNQTYFIFCMGFSLKLLCRLDSVSDGTQNTWLWIYGI